MNRILKLAFALALATLLVRPGDAWGQLPAGPMTHRGLLGIGYVANAPESMLGATFWAIIPGLHGWGLYVDAKMDPWNPVGDGFLYPDLTVVDVDAEWPNDLEFVSESRWRGVNLALTREVTPELVVYAGGGYAEETVYTEFKDSQEDRGELGWYWVKNPDKSRSGVNLLVGALMRIAPHVRIQFGGEARPVGFTVGLSYLLGGH